MSHVEFFHDSARQCRQMARSAADDYVRWQLFLWAREFDRIAAEGQPRRETVASFLARFARKRQRQLAAAD